VLRLESRRPKAAEGWGVGGAEGGEGEGLLKEEQRSLKLYYTQGTNSISVGK